MKILKGSIPENRWLYVEGEGEKEEVDVVVAVDVDVEVVAFLYREIRTHLRL